jgi:sugar transferase EpsL
MPWEKRLELDAWYVENRTFWLDIKILLSTVRKVMSGEGVAQEGKATVDRFPGNQL